MRFNTASAGGLALFKESGSPISLGRDIGGGGEGRIFTVHGDSKRVAKIYKRRTAGQAEKLRSMLKGAPESVPAGPGSHTPFCWPEELLFDRNAECAGFLMPRLDLSVYHPISIYWNAEDRAAVAPGFTWKYLCVTAANVASLVDLIHQKGHVIGDVNDENLLADDRTLVSLVDCDSMQIKDPETGVVYRCGVGREAYTSPDRIGLPFASFDRSARDDDWALAVLIFTMLMEGHHPADGIGYPQERRERIEKGLFAFLTEPDLLPPKYALRFDTLPESLRTLFLRCFRAGHGDPEARPRAAEWSNELTQVAAKLVQCDQLDLHWFPEDASVCPWCEQRELWGVERFATDPASVTVGAGAHQVALPPATRVRRASGASAPSSAGVSSGWRIRSGILAAAACLVLAAGGASMLLNKSRPDMVKPPIVQGTKQGTEARPGGTVPANPSTSKDAADSARPPEDRRPPVAGAEKLRHASTRPTPKRPPSVVPWVKPATTGPVIEPAVSPPPVATIVPFPATADPLPATTPPAHTRPPDAQAETARATDARVLADLHRSLEELKSHFKPPSAAGGRSEPRSGILVWSGQVSKGVPVTIEGGATQLGVVNGDLLPGVQVVIEKVTPDGVVITEAPSSSMGYQRLVFRSSFSRKQVITFAWRTP